MRQLRKPRIARIPMAAPICVTRATAGLRSATSSSGRGCALRPPAMSRVGPPVDRVDEGPVTAASELVGNASRMPGRGLATSATPPNG